MNDWWALFAVMVGLWLAGVLVPCGVAGWLARDDVRDDR